MGDWIDEYAERLGVAPVTPEDMGALLKLAREVAHGSDDRRLAPLSTFLAGVRAGRADPDDAESRSREISAALEAARAMLPVRPDPQAG